MKPANLVTLLSFVAAYMPYASSFWYGKGEETPVHCPMVHESWVEIEPVTLTQVLRRSQYATKDVYVPTYVTEAVTHEVSSFIHQTVTATPEPMTVWTMALTTVTKVNTDPVISTVLTTILYTDVSFTTLTSTSFATTTATIPATQSLQVADTSTLTSTRLLTLFVTQTVTVGEIAPSLPRHTSTITVLATVTSTLCQYD